jgi:1,4-dihydroxy-2-naphthoate octaprenyltransferase
VTGSHFLLNEQVRLSSYRWIAAGCFAVALVCGVALSFFRPLALAFGAVGFLLAFFYVAPPLRLAYIGRGLGELDILLSFGVLPLVGAFYVQAGTVTLAVLLASLPIGLYTMSVLYFHHFLHWRGDLAAGKITPVVALGERGARIAGALILLLVALAFLLDAVLNVYPWYSAVAILTILPTQVLLRRATNDLKFYLQLMATNFNGNVQAAFLVVLALVIRGLLHI